MGVCCKNLMAWIQFLGSMVEGKNQLFLEWVCSHWHTIIYTIIINVKQVWVFRVCQHSFINNKEMYHFEGVGNGVDVLCVINQRELCNSQFCCEPETVLTSEGYLQKVNSIHSSCLSPRSNCHLKFKNHSLYHLCASNSWAPASSSAFLLSCRIKCLMTCLTSPLEWSIW